MNRGESVYTGPESGNRKFRARLCGLLMILALALSSQAAQAQVEVDLALCIDGSGSISTADFDLQRDAYIDALNALVPRDGTVRLSIFQFSQAIVTELSPLVIAAEGDMTTVITALNDMVQEDGVTNTEGCIRTAADAIDSDELQARKIIDMSTDGVPTWNVNGDNCVGDPIPNVCSDAAIQASDDIELAGIINAFNVIAVGPGAPLDYMDDLPFPAPVGSPSGGYPDPGSPPDTDGFIVPVATFDAFETALEQKLLIELSVTFDVTKAWVGAAAPGEVTIQLACSGTDVQIDGMASPQSKLTTANVASFSVTGSDVGLCTATEETGISGLWIVNEANCADVDPETQMSCTITNTRRVPAYTIDKTITDVGGDGPGGQVNEAGDVISYSIVVTNTGNQVITGVTLTDPLLQGAQGTLGPEVESMADDDILEIGETWTYSGTWTATQSDIDDNCGGDAQISNTATVDSNELGAQIDSVTAQCTQNPAYTIVKTADDVNGGALQVTAAGDVINYTIVVTNTGNQTITGVTLSDPLLEGANGTLLGPIESISTNGNLDVGETWTYSGTYTVQQSDLDSGCGGDGQISNMATVDSNELEPNNDTANVPCSAESSFALVKSVTDVDGDGPSGQVNAAGDVVTYSIVVSNTGNTTVTNVVLTDALLEGANGTLVGPTESVLPADGDLDVGETWEYTGTYTAQQSDIDDNCGGDGSIDNTAIVNATEFGPQQDSASAACVPSPAHTIVKTITDVDGGGPSGNVDAAGDVITYSIVVSNTGNQTIAGAVVTDPLLEGANGTLLGPTESISTNGDLDVGETWTYSGTYTVQQADLDDNCGGDLQISNTATVDSSVLGPQSDVANAACVSNPGILLIKTGVFTDNDTADGTAQPGELIAYTFTVTNTGNVTLTNISVSDPLVSPITCPGGNPIPSLAPGAQTVCTGSYAVTQDDINSGSVFNLASACTVPPGGGELCDEDDHEEVLPLLEVAIPSMTTYGLLLMVLTLMLAGLYGYRVRGHKRVV